MAAILRNLPEMVALLGWTALWALGGIWLVGAAFQLRRNETALVGVAVGLVIQTLLANMLARVLAFPVSIWLSAALVCAAGAVLTGRTRGWRSLYRVPVQPGQWLVLLLLVGVFTQIGRGLAIFDDYAHLPTTSMMMTGDIPPRFALDPEVSYGYHYFLMLWAAQLGRLAGLYPWSALDVARGLSFGLAVVLAAVWTRRLTRSRAAGVLGGLMLAFGMGTRWLLLLLPSGVISALSGQLTLIGSGLQSGPDLAAALTNVWVIEGGGPMPFPFAFVNGLLSPGVMAHGSGGMIGSVVSFPLLLTFNRWRNWSGGVVSALLLAATALMTEMGVVLPIIGWAAVTGLYMIQNKTVRLPGSLWAWLAVMAGGVALGLLQGGALTDLLGGWVEETVSGAAAASYQTVGFRLAFPPQIVSAHLGVMSLFNPAQLLAALAEMGPVILVLPLAALWAWKAYRAGRWYEAALIVSALVSIGALLVEFTGSTGVRNTSRLFSFPGLARTWAVPLVWMWAARRKEWVKTVAAVLMGVTVFGGLVLFGAELPAMQQPVRTYFVGDLDVLAERDYWNRLEPEAVVFDPVPHRSPTLFGRPTNSSFSWYAQKPEWSALTAAPDPSALRAAGFHYAYVDTRYWDGLKPEYQEKLSGGCVKLVQEYEDYRHEFRRLLDLRGCVP